MSLQQSAAVAAQHRAQYLLMLLQRCLLPLDIFLLCLLPLCFERGAALTGQLCQEGGGDRVRDSQPWASPPHPTLVARTSASDLVTVGGE